MVKLGMALAFACIAVLVIMVGGVLHEARLGTIALRCLGGFLATSWVIYVVAFILEAKDIVAFDKDMEPPPTEGESVAGEDEAAADSGEDGNPDEESADGDGEESASEEGTGFTPLATQNLRHVSAPPES